MRIDTRFESEDIIAEAVNAYKSGKINKDQARVILGIAVHKRASSFISKSIRQLIYKYHKKGLKYV